MLYRFLKVGGSEGSGELKKNSWKNVDIKIQKLEVVRVVENWKQNNLTNVNTLILKSPWLRPARVVGNWKKNLK